MSYDNSHVNHFGIVPIQWYEKYDHEYCMRSHSVCGNRDYIVWTCEAHFES